ncbi:uncharacterized protein LOC135338422 isoform X2 [Halichondria panicea]|uniref:uncharacterized protein LOC135338422 isoform X2 n=1 Tax=Halichondria panicea TaxID=6063 RepID=UPI00312BC597
MSTRRGHRRLRLLIDQAYGLQKRDVFGLSDPYVKVSFYNAINIRGHHKTSAIKKTLRPKWNEVLDFDVAVLERKFTVIFDLFDENLLISDDFLGRAVFHVDFSDTDPETSPCVSDVAVTTIDDIKSVGRLLTLALKDKYSDSHFTGAMSIPHVRQMRQEFLQKRLHKAREHEETWGGLQVYYVFEEPPRARAHTQPSLTASSLSLTAPTTPEATHTSPGASPAPESTADSDEDDTVLPEGWEMRVDSNRRQMFVNRDLHRVSLRRPSNIPAALTQELQNAVGARRRFQERSTSIDVIIERSESTVSEDSRPPDAGAGTGLGPSTQQDDWVLVGEQPPAEPTATETSTAEVGTPTAAIAAIVGEATASVPPPVVTTGSVGGASLLGSTEAPQLTTALQRASEGLAAGWVAGMSLDGRIYYIDHNTHSTTWEKPRLLERRPTSEETGHGAQQAEQDKDLPPGWEVRKAKDGRTYYVDHNTHRTVWEHPMETSQRLAKEDELGPLPSNWEVKQMPDGRIFYVDHITHSTQWEDPRLLAKNKPTYKIQYSRDYKQKYVNFRSKLGPKHQIPRQCKIPCRRSQVFEDSYNFIMNVRDIETLKARLYVEFQGETGLDYGGVAREWFHLLSHEMFNPYYGLFEYSASDDYTLQISPNSGAYNERHLEYFRFVGRICGMAVYHNRLIDAFFIRPFYKMMLSKAITLEDMQAVDVEMYHSFQYILDNDPEPLCLDYSVNSSVFGELTVVDLKPNGRNIPVTEANKKAYLDLMMKWRFSDRVQDQMKAFLKGFSDLIPLRLIKVFDEREMEYLLGGLAVIDMDDWRRNTDYDGYAPHDNVAVWFWKAVENYDNEMRARLLQFVTGTSKVPMNGFSELQGSQGPRRFCIKRYGQPDSLPRAHTCFNRLDLPPYPSYHKLKEMLRLAVENTEGFEGVD